MSAYIQPKTHIDYLITAGLVLARRSRLQGFRLRWMAPGPERETDSEMGEAWGPTWIQTVQERSRELTDETADQVGAMLVLENVRSVGYRYASPVVAVDGIATPTHYRGTDDILPGPNDPYYTRPYVYPKADVIRRRIDPVEVLMAIQGYEYQSCEHPGWHASEAKDFCDALRKLAISSLPGYDKAHTWSVSE